MAWNDEKHVDKTELDRWMYAVELQAGRATSQPDDLFSIEPDVMFLVLSARLLYLSAHQTSCRHPEARSAIDKAKRDFEKTVGKLTVERDLISHFDEYARGSGKHIPVPISPWTVEDDDGAVTLSFTAGMTITVDTVLRSCTALYGASVSALRSA